MLKIISNVARRTDMKIVYGLGFLSGAFVTRCAQEYGKLKYKESISQKRKDDSDARASFRFWLIRMANEMHNDGYTNENIAKVLEVSESSVRTLIETKPTPS